MSITQPAGLNFPSATMSDDVDNDVQRQRRPGFSGFLNNRGQYRTHRQTARQPSSQGRVQWTVDKKQFAQTHSMVYIVH